MPAHAGQYTRRLSGKSRSRRSRRTCGPAGFSLIELLITLALVVVMYVLYLSAGSQHFQTKQKRACQKNLQNAYVALKTYSIENGDRFPAAFDAATSEVPLSLLIPRCTTVTKLFICPGTKDKVPPQAKPFADAKISYAYYMGRDTTQPAQMPLMSDEQVNTNSKSAGQALFSANGETLGNNHHKYGGVILFRDGTAQLSGTNAATPLPLGTGVKLLNPKP